MKLAVFNESSHSITPFTCMCVVASRKILINAYWSSAAVDAGSRTEHESQSKNFFHPPESQHENAFERGKVHDTARERSKVNWRCINIITIKMCMMDGNLSKISTKFESVCGAVECFKMAALPVHWVQKHWKVSNRLRTRENVSHTFHKFFGWHTNDNCLSTQRNSCIFICYVISALGETIRSKRIREGERKMKWARHKFVFMSILCRVYFFISFFWHFSFTTQFHV